jgi:hypothetical protein
VLGLAALDSVIMRPTPHRPATLARLLDLVFIGVRGQLEPGRGASLGHRVEGLARLAVLLVGRRLRGRPVPWLRISTQRRRRPRDAGELFRRPARLPFGLPAHARSPASWDCLLPADALTTARPRVSMGVRGHDLRPCARPGIAEVMPEIRSRMMNSSHTDGTEQAAAPSARRAIVRGVALSRAPAPRLLSGSPGRAADLIGFIAPIAAVAAIVPWPSRTATGTQSPAGRHRMARRSLWLWQARADLEDPAKSRGGPGRPLAGDHRRGPSLSS